MMLRTLALLLCSASVSLAAPPQKAKPRVLILGDSISIGYTPFVQQMMAGEAEAVRPMRGKRAENCAGTTYGVANVKRWLKIGGGNWNVIHFNFGLHDLKRVHPKTGKVSRDPNDPRQADLARYEKQLRQIVKVLKTTKAKLILCTTTPVPKGKVNPHRDPEDVVKYNAVAARIAKENGIAVNDLYSFALPRLKRIQRPVNVHFVKEGSRQLGEQVTKAIRAALK